MTVWLVLINHDHQDSAVLVSESSHLKQQVMVLLNCQLVTHGNNKKMTTLSCFYTTGAYAAALLYMAL